MQHVFNKKDFYKMILRDRFAIAEVVFPIGNGEGKIEFFTSPMGVIMLAKTGEKNNLQEIKLYDKMRGKFIMPNLFCHDNLACIEEGCFVSVSGKIQIEDVFNRDFLVRVNDQTIIAKATIVPKDARTVDKRMSLVYN